MRERIPRSNSMEGGSGKRAMETNEQALETARKEMKELQNRNDRGEDIDPNKIRRLHERIQRFKKDQGLIEAADQ